MTPPYLPAAGLPNVPLLSSMLSLLEMVPLPSPRPKLVSLMFQKDSPFFPSGLYLTVNCLKEAFPDHTR